MKQPFVTMVDSIVLVFSAEINIPPHPKDTSLLIFDNKFHVKNQFEISLCHEIFRKFAFLELHGIVIPFNYVT